MNTRNPQSCFFRQTPLLWPLSSGRLTTWSAIAVGLAGTMPAATAADAAAEATKTAKPEPSIYDKIWGATDLYKNPENPIIQNVKFTGRFQLDYANVDSAQGNHGEWNIRRFRLGGKATVFKDFTVHCEVDLNPQDGQPDMPHKAFDTYRALTDAYVAWSREKSFVATVGKHSAPFTGDGMTSSKELLALDRSNLANNFWFPQEYMPGISVSGKPGQWLYQLGGYTSGSTADEVGGIPKEFGEFDGGYFLLATVGYDFGKQLGVKEAILAANYVFNEKDEDNTFTRNLQDVVSINFRFDTGKWGVRTDITVAKGYRGQSDAWGAMIMPFYNITKNLQAVARYTYLNSDDNNGLRLALYENTVVTGRGDEYNEGYFGLNYYFYGHKLKIQSGLQYADMKDGANDGGRYYGWSWVTGLRVGW